MTEPTIGEEGIEAAANALLHGEVWGPQNGPLDEESSEALDRLARAAITAYLATQRAPDEELGPILVIRYLSNERFHVHGDTLYDIGWGGSCLGCLNAAEGSL